MHKYRVNSLYYPNLEDISTKYIAKYVLETFNKALKKWNSYFLLVKTYMHNF